MKSLLQGWRWGGSVSCTAGLCRDARILDKVKFSLNIFSSFQDSPKSTKSTTKPGSGSSGKDGGADNSEEVRLSPWIQQSVCATHLLATMTSFILAASGCSAR